MPYISQHGIKAKVTIQGKGISSRDTQALKDQNLEGYQSEVKKCQNPRSKKSTLEEALGSSRDHKDPTQVKGTYKSSFLKTIHPREARSRMLSSS